MKYLQELRRRKTEAVKNARNLLDTAKKEDRSMSDDENAKWSNLIADAEKIQKDIEIEERQVELDRETATASVETEERAEIKPGDADRMKFKSIGEQLRSVMIAGQSEGRQIDNRLIEMEKRAASGMALNPNSDGGFLVQQDFSEILMDGMTDTGVIYNQVDKVPLSSGSNGIKLPYIDEASRASSRLGGVLGYWSGEAEALTASKPKIGQIDLSLQKLTGLMYATDELLADSAALGNRAAMWFGEEFGFKMDDAIVNGTGAGMPLGIMNSNALVTVAKETGQTAATVVSENVFKMYARMKASSLSGANWYINQDVWPQLFALSLAVGTAGGSVVFVNGGNIAGAPFGTLMGRPIFPLEQCATVGSKGDIIFCNPSAYLMAEKGGIKADSSIHVKFTTDETAFRFILRANGQPKESTTLTPAKGSNTQSSYIALAVRA